MIRLEFGDAMRRLRAGETLVATSICQYLPTTLDARGLWIYKDDNWIIAPDPLGFIMYSDWFIDENPPNGRKPLPVGPAPTGRG
jgi:hypothetical protein